jgi:8-oxo-dGTP pyrophosphatase MutT (NUDIX family)
LREKETLMRKNGNWKIKNTKKIFENDHFKVLEDEVVRPDGEDGKYATIRFPAGASVLPVDENNFVYLTKQFRYALERKDLEAISGAVEGESVLETAKKEAEEELGIKAEEWTNLGKIEDNTSITNSTAHLYLARRLKFGEPKPENTEEIKMVKMKLETAFEKVMNGEITHSQTCILILKTYLYLSETDRK